MQVIRSHLLSFYSEVQKFIKLFRFHSTILIHTRKPVADHLLAFKENIFETVVFVYYKAAQRVAQCKNLPIFFLSELDDQLFESREILYWKY